jgi:putative sterol carrier protein
VESESRGAISVTTVTLNHKDQTCTVSEGVHDKPTLSLRMTDKNWVALCKGELNAVFAFMSGKLKAKGDIMLAQRMTKLFSIG